MMDGDGKPIANEEWYWIKSETGSNRWEAALSYISDGELQWWLWGLDYPIEDPELMIGSHIERPSQ